MKKSFWLPIALGLCAYLVLPLPGLSAPLSDRIDQKPTEIEHAKQKEGVLTTTIQSFSNRIDSLQGEIQATQDRLDRAQSSLDRQKNELLEVRDRLEVARDRLARLRSELATARRLLAARLVEIYKSDTPDALTVVLEADGFERPAGADRVPRAHLRPGPRDHRPRARAARPGPGPGRRARQARGARAAGGGAHPARARPDRLGAEPAGLLARPARVGAGRQAWARWRSVRDREGGRDGGPRVAGGRAGARRGRAPGSAARVRSSRAPAS